MSSLFNSLTRWDRLGKLPALMLLLMFSGAGLHASPAVRIAWDPNPEGNIAGYRIYFGQSGGVQTNIVYVGDNTVGSITNLAFATSYFFYVTAYNVFGLESDPSEILTYETPGPLSLSLEPHLIVLTPSDVTLRPRLSGYLQPGAGLTFSWQQLGGPEWLTVAGLTTLTPMLQLRTPGYYNLQLTVTEGTNSLVANTTLLALDSAAASAGLDPLVVTYFQAPPDGLLLSWNSEPGAAYLVGRQPELDGGFWVSETETSIIPSAGLLTDFVIGQEKLNQLKQGFFTVFRLP
jgi:hypothetical protein